MQDKNNTCTLLKNIKLIGIRCETGKKTSAKPRDMLPVSKARTNKFDIFRQCTYIVNGLGGRIVVYISQKNSIKDLNVHFTGLF